MILSDADYTAISHNGAPYEIFDNPGSFPQNVDATDAVNRERQVAEHKGEIKEYEMQLLAMSWARKAIVAAVDECWLSEIKSPHVGFNHLTPFQLLTHLESVGAQLDFIDVTELQAELFAPWDQVEAPISMFERQDKIEKQLVKAGIPAQAELRLALARTWFEQTGEYDIALAKWDTLPAANRTLPAFRVMIQAEFLKQTKRDRQTANHGGRRSRDSGNGNGRIRQCSHSTVKCTNGKDDGNVRKGNDCKAIRSVAEHDFHSPKVSPLPAPPSQAR